MPVIIDNIIFLTNWDVSAAVGITRRAVNKSMGLGRIATYQSEQHGKLIEFKSLKWDWKQKINDYYNGNVRKYTQLQEIEQRLGYCPEIDRDFLKDLILPKGTHLSPKKRKICEQKCQILSFLARLQPLTNGKTREFGVENKQEFWKLMGEFIKKKEIKLPKNARRLSDLVKKYMELGAAATVSGRWGNNNSQKIGEKERQLIIELYADRDGRKFTGREVHKQFLAIAAENGWEHCKDVTYRVIANVIRNSKGEWHMERHGEKDFALNQTMTINRRPTSKRNIVWQLDGTPEHAWYYDEQNNTVNKLYVFKVMESKTWKVVGYAVGYAETANLVFEAYKMGVKLTGVRPLETRGDKGSALQAGETKALMHSLGVRYYPTATGNSRGKSIESWQKHFNEQVLSYLPNKSSGNITNKSLNSQQNPDKLKANYKGYPSKKQLHRQIVKSIALWNNWKNSKGVTPNERYEEAEEAGKAVNTYEQFELFAVWRMNGKTIRPYQFKMDGLTIEISGNKYRYIPDVDEAELAAFMNRHIDTTTFYVKYDPSDLEQIAIYTLPSGMERNEENMRFVSHLVLKGTTAETSLDATDEEQARYKRFRKVQIEQKRQAQEATEHRRDYLAHENILSGAVELKRIHKDSYNNAELEVQRLEMLGYNYEITSDKNKELSALSMMDDVDWLKDDDTEQEENDLNVYGLPKARS